MIHTILLLIIFLPYFLNAQRIKEYDKHDLLNSRIRTSLRILDPEDCIAVSFEYGVKSYKINRSGIIAEVPYIINKSMINDSSNLSDLKYIRKHAYIFPIYTFENQYVSKYYLSLSQLSVLINYGHTHTAHIDSCLRILITTFHKYTYDAYFNFEFRHVRTINDVKIYNIFLSNPSHSLLVGFKANAILLRRFLLLSPNVKLLKYYNTALIINSMASEACSLCDFDLDYYVTP